MKYCINIVNRRRCRQMMQQLLSQVADVQQCVKAAQAVLKDVRAVFAAATAKQREERAKLDKDKPAAKASTRRAKAKASAK